MCDNEMYEFFGSYPNADARLILDAFLEENIRYKVGIDDSFLTSLNVVGAAMGGGTGGQASEMLIAVHKDDVDIAIAIRQRVLNINKWFDIENGRK